MINLLMLGEEILAYGGAITLRRPDAGEAHGVNLEIVGRAAQLSPLLQGALDGGLP